MTEQTHPLLLNKAITDRLAAAESLVSHWHERPAMISAMKILIEGLPHDANVGQVIAAIDELACGMSPFATKREFHLAMAKELAPSELAKRSTNL